MVLSCDTVQEPEVVFGHFHRISIIFPKCSGLDKSSVHVKPTITLT